MNIRHPWKGTFPFVMTTDFLITKADGFHARTIKCSEELENPRVVEKFSIEYAYWLDKGIDWKIVTEKEISKSTALNLQWLYSGERPEALLPDHAILPSVRRAILALIDEQGVLPTYCIASLEDFFHLKPGCAISIYKTLVLEGRISPDLSRQLFF